MYCSKPIIINERPNNSTSQLNTPTPDSPTSLSSYSLTQQFFDPSKASPPNEFMLKLQKRMGEYGKSHIK